MPAMESESTPFAEISRMAVSIISWCVSTKPLFRRCAVSSGVGSMLLGMAVTLTLHYRRGEATMSGQHQYLLAETEEALALGTGPIPVGPYYRDDCFALEREAIFKRTWLNIGHVCELPEPGSFIVRQFDFANASILVTRYRDGTICASSIRALAVAVRRGRAGPENQISNPERHGFFGEHRTQKIWTNLAPQLSTTQKLAFDKLMPTLMQRGMMNTAHARDYYVLFPNFFLIGTPTQHFTHYVMPISARKSRGVIHLYWVGDDMSASERFGRKFSMAMVRDVHA
jgi:hypothetical protein